MCAKRIDLTGQRFGLLVVVGVAADVRHSPTRLESAWLCRCDCGNDVVRRTRVLRRRSDQNDQSCGCMANKMLADRTRTHGMRDSRLYNIWRGMLKRCFNPNHRAYDRYAGRGIGVCDRWLTFEAFAADVGEPPDDALTLDRKDNDRGYEPGNTRWATRTVQRINSRQTVNWVVLDGERMPLMHAARLLKRRSADFYEYRLQKSASLQDAVDHYARKR